MLRVLSLFSGIGAFEKALEKNKVDFELVNYCEIDKYASKAYSIIHNVSEDLNLRDVTKVDTSKLSNIDLITYGFPCQDISVAGKQKGFEDSNGNRTRSGLFFEALRIIKDTQPKYAIAENVKALTSNKFTNEFNTVLNELSNAGYNNYYKVLNAKDYGIPQNRERVFIISIRKDIDDYFFNFPEKQELKLRLKDVLEDKVDEKYYISSENVTWLMKEFNKSSQIKIVGNTKSGGERSAILHTDGISNCLSATDYKQPKQILEDGVILDDTQGFDGVRTYTEYAPTLRSERSGLKTVESVKSNNIEVISNYSPSMHDASRIVSTNGVAPTVKENHGTVTAIVEDEE